MKKKKRKSSTGEWLNTYSDMVTLLLCFFVLMYSISSVDSAKWKIIVQSFNPSQGELSQVVDNLKQNNGGYAVDGGLDGGAEDIDKAENFDDKDIEKAQDFDDIYYKLSKYVQSEGLDSEVSISKGDGFTFITFRDKVFFDGNSYILKDEGKKILDQLCYAISDVSKSIGEIQVLGHTSQASPDVQNDVESDRFLSSDRATEVLVYIQEKNIIDPSKLVSTGFGQFRPIASFDTWEDRAKNRRVEILITKSNQVVKSLDNYYKEVYGIDTNNNN
ncbi:MAG: flagellar motor protein MotB [Clostridia bacterium]|jgi:chemotaxis protein MotB|nr:flagellar motor protein MotB [Clostridia bacterium]